MKKRGTIKPHKDNIFLFPNVDKLLLDKGLESLKNKRFVEAVDYLEKAKELDSYNEELELSLIIAYLESGNLSNAKNLANECLQKGIGDYFQLIDLYLMILLQLNEYQEIVVTLEALLEEKEIPIEKLGNFTKILEFSKRKLESDYIKSGIESIEDDFQEEISFDLFQYENLNEQFLAVAQLSEKNVRNYLPGIKTYLSSSAGHPFIKTMLLQLLKEQQVNEEIKVEKFHQNLVINPIYLAEIAALADINEIYIILKRELEHDNPTLFESIKAIVDRHSFLLFPIERKPNEPIILAAAYHFLALEYFGIHMTIEKMVEKYEVDVRKLTGAIALLRELEEISSPIL
ncbi:tetratricopeptide repeat protein [Neobacillus sp. D3-1R]|uniref:tetratricopeptide repeat protein n=1 Tax=Neobacillus sp. D3-1R TaxID=3445778 RepID=UPI003F9FEA2B